MATGWRGDGSAEKKIKIKIMRSAKKKGMPGTPPHLATASQHQYSPLAEADALPR
jgi:hypothetical protein